MKRKEIQPGCEVLVDDPPPWLSSGRLGLLANQASVSRAFEPVGDLIAKAGGKLRCLFSPQHGFHAEKQANMQESSDDWSSSFQIPVISLYAGVRQPTEEMLEKIDVLVIDLQDVGTRVYTYTTTMGLCMEAAAAAGVKVVVLDRPNPVSGLHVEGNILKESHRSFVGRYPIPMRHGLTMGEMARFIVTKCRIDCDLEVIPMKGWRRGDFFPDTHLPWVFPSPNMPSWETALVYPGMVLFEGANVSEGRGTTLPFHLFGAPFIAQQEVHRFLKQKDMEGVVLRPVSFEPVFDKWQGQTCYGFQIHVTDREKFMPYRLGLCLLQALYHVHGDRFRWLSPPYEYEWEKLPIDILLGDAELRQEIERGADLADLEAGWEPELTRYRNEAEGCFIYWK